MCCLPRAPNISDVYLIETIESVAPPPDETESHSLGPSGGKTPPSEQPSEIPENALQYITVKQRVRPSSKPRRLIYTLLKTTPLVCSSSHVCQPTKAPVVWKHDILFVFSDFLTCEYTESSRKASVGMPTLPIHF
ncbi:hypothetical protein T265_06772 [Opisthorchis viverrini]|uniref:Uncharacterized protein n=1 Tax=Opisthorchis viverrini TaxID=6198 RepID=A0A075AD57_OPIVI|nr:hypothetical protein T265_06772 [Opisthorchis viverrini]KER25859.1 hypothetical protein T265_06772 [Opisthorchis viverrini]